MNETWFKRKEIKVLEHKGLLISYSSFGHKKPRKCKIDPNKWYGLYF